MGHYGPFGPCPKKHVIIKNMEIKTVVVGSIHTNCYIVSEENSKEAIIIDPGDEAEKIIAAAEGLKVKAVVLTHGHWDHVTAAPIVAKHFNAPLCIHKNDEAMMTYSNQIKADRLLKAGDKFDIGHLSFVILHSPGHSAGCICLYDGKKTLFSGDTLFRGTWGRTDLPTSSETDMEKSLKKLLSLPADVVVYPGHGKKTTIGEEKNLI